jgi:guanylate kinase
VKGGLHVQRQFPKTSLSLFIQPPSIDELKRRLESRGTETDDSLQARINKSSYELSFSHEFDQIIINSDLEKACNEAEKIVRQFITN